MEKNVCRNEGLDNYISEIGARAAAESGIPTDRYHYGKLILQSLKDNPDLVNQIDGATVKSETNGAVLKRSIRCTACFRKLGLAVGDLIIVMGYHNLDQAIPMYASLFEGIIIAAIDKTLTVNELKAVFTANKPKLVFCQGDKVQDAKKAKELTGFDGRVISYDSSPDAITLTEMLEKYGEDIDVQDYKCADFDAEETISVILATSGSTGLPKACILTYKNLTISSTNFCCFGTQFPKITESALVLSPIQWFSGLSHYLLGPIFQYTRVQSSKELTTEHMFEMIHKYKPTYLIASPPLAITLLNAAEKYNCDFSSFEYIYLGGSAVPDQIVTQFRALTPTARIAVGFGMSEIGGIVFYPWYDAPLGSIGRRFAHLQYKLVNIETGEEVKEPNKTGELWVKATGGIRGYYNYPVETAEVMTEDGWFKSGDLLYRDEDWNVFFVERIKLLLKYRNHQISPVELEGVIHKLPGVENVAVTGVADLECGELPIAFVVKKAGATLTEQDVKDIVKENLTDSKLLRGGVVFVKELPLLPNSKLDRKKLRQMATAYAKKN